MSRARGLQLGAPTGPVPPVAAEDGAGLVPVSAPSAGAGAAPEARPPALVGRRIPSRNSRVRRLVVALYFEASWLAGADLPAAVRWATLSEKFRRLAQHLDNLPEGGVVKVDGDPRKALGELRALSGEITRLENALGITAAPRAGLGVNLGRMEDLAVSMSRRAGRGS